MTSLDRVVAECVQAELAARANFARLQTLPAREIRLAIENDPSLQSEFLARHILDYCDALTDSDSIAAEHVLDLLEAAAIAGHSAEPHLRCRIEKDLANAFRFVGRFADAEVALQRGAEQARKALSPRVHHAMIQFGRMALCCDLEQIPRAVYYACAAIAGFARHGAFDRLHRVRLYLAWICARRGDHLTALAIFRDYARRARRAGCQVELARAYANIGHSYRSLHDFENARTWFLKCAEVWALCGNPLARARALRCVARMAIQSRGEAASVEMEPAKRLFLELGLAGEVCRSIVGIMEELLRRDPKTDLTPYCLQLQDEARELGVLPLIRPAVDRLHRAARNREITEQTLEDVWTAFGPVFSSAPSPSAMETVSN